MKSLLCFVILFSINVFVDYSEFVAKICSARTTVTVGASNSSAVSC